MAKANDAAEQHRSTATASALSVTDKSDEIARAVSDDWPSGAAESGQHQFAWIPVGNWTGTIRLDALGDEFVIEKVQTTGVRGAFGGDGTCFGKAVTVEGLLAKPLRPIGARI